jgi:RNA polymerase sigma factor (sigma-70 family)
MEIMEEARFPLRIRRGGVTRDDAMAHAEDVFRYVFARMGSVEETEDIVMEVIQAALEDTQLAKSRLLMLRNARNRVIDRLRKRRVREGYSPEDSDSQSPDLDLVVRIKQVLSEMSQGNSDLIVLKYVHGLTSGEISRLTGLTKAAVNSALQRAREEFRLLAPDLQPNQGDENV